MILDLLFGIIKKNSRFIRYCIGGGLAFLVDLSLLYILTEYFGLWYLWSATLSFVVTAMVNYTIQKYWTFRNASRQVFQQFAIFISIQILGLILNTLLLYLFVEYVGLWYMFGKVLAAGLVLLWNFWAGKKFVFQTDRADIVIAGEIFPPAIGGPATYTYRLAEYLLAQHYRFIVLCYASRQSSFPQDALAQWVIKINGDLPVPIKYFIYFLRLFSLSIHAKVIYAQGPVASGWPALLVSKILGKKLVVKVVGDYAWEQAQLAHLTPAGIDAWQVEQVFVPQKYFTRQKIKIIAYLEHLVVRQATQVIVPSHYLKKIVLGWGAKPSQVKVIYNSFAPKAKNNLSRAAAQSQIKISGDLLITVARLLPWKGIAMLIDIMPELLKFNPDFKLLVAGDGPTRTSLEKLSADRGLHKQVYFLGNLSQPDLSTYYAASSLFVLNSGYEGLSHAILDAMHYRLPAIVSNIGGNPELIQDDYNGLLVAYDHGPDWIAAIERLWSDEKLRERLADNPLVQLEVFSFERMIQETLGVIQN